MLSELGLSPPLARRRDALATLGFALLCGPFAFVREQLPLVSGALPLVRQALALVGDPLALVHHALALVGGGLALAQALSSPLERLRLVLAPPGDVLTLLGKLLPLLGDVLTLRGNSLPFASHPKKLVPLIRWLLRLVRARGNSSLWTFVPHAFGRELSM